MNTSEYNRLLELTNSIPAQILVPEQALLCYRGSVAHGTYTNDSDDVDVLSVYMGDIARYFGFPKKTKGKDTKIDKWDVVKYEFRHYVRLLSKGNPNVLSTLFLNNLHIVKSSPAFQTIKKHRQLFVTRSTYNTFYNYAKAQCKRMVSGQKYNGYMGAKRKALTDSCGYDPRNAAHSIRIARMGTELLSTGTMHVDRSNKDADFLRDVKSGMVPLLEVTCVVTTCLEDLNTAYEESAKMSLPDKPDLEKIEKLLVSIMMRYFVRGRFDTGQLEILER